MSRSYRVAIPLAFLAIFLMGAVGCSKKEEAPKAADLKAPDPKTGIREADFVWGKATAQFVDFYFQPSDSARLFAQPLANKASEVYLTIGAMLGYLQPTPIEFYCYDNQYMLNLYTGRTDAFFIDNKIYYGYGPPYGEVFANFVIGKLPGGPSTFSFLREGVPMLLDYTGRNYHHSTNNFLTDGTINPISKLADEASYAKMQGSQKIIESASLCGYIMYEYSYERFMALYHESGKFEDALKKTINIDVDSLERGWHAFLPEHTVEKEEEREKAQQGGGS